MESEGRVIHRIVAPTALTTRAWQMQIGSVVVGAGSSFPWQADELPGWWWTMPTVRAYDQPLPGRHGVTAVPDVMPARDITLPMQMILASPAEANALLGPLREVFTPAADDEDPLTVIRHEPDATTRWTWCRPRGLDVVFPSRRLASVLLAGRLRLPDPRWYASTATEWTLTHGRWTRITVPGVVASGWELEVEQGGDAPVSIVRIEHAPSGRTVQASDLGTSSVWPPALGEVGSMGLPPYPFVLLDGRRRTLETAGMNGSPWNIDGTSRWFSLQPGENWVRVTSYTSTDVTITLRSWGGWL